MPRAARLDAPGVLHHVMGRGLDRQIIFRDDQDRAYFVRRLDTLVAAQALTVYAWALLPNHFHLLVRTESRPLPRSMRALLTGYAGAFNRRHHRTGHLFQNRYKSIVVEEELYLLELVRYLHLNPLRAGKVSGLSALAGYPWCGHSALLGRVPRPWQETAEILGRFAPTVARARRTYRTFVAAGAPQGRRPDLQGGGLLRSLGGWEAVAALRRGRESYLADERILGSSPFVETLRAEAERAERQRLRLRARTPDLPTLLSKVARAAGLAPKALQGGGRSRALVRARDGLAYLWIEFLGRSGHDLARALALHPVSVYRAARRGRTHGKEWDRFVKAFD
jgi:REP element-mobilizing transposase RayT